MSLKAYQNTQSISEDPRHTEYRLFGQVTGALIDAQKNGAKGGPLAETLDWKPRGVPEPVSSRIIRPITAMPNVTNRTTIPVNISQVVRDPTA